jgi:hypothetical protein
MLLLLQFFCPPQEAVFNEKQVSVSVFGQLGETSNVAASNFGLPLVVADNVTKLSSVNVAEDPKRYSERFIMVQAGIFKCSHCNILLKFCQQDDFRRQTLDQHESGEMACDPRIKLDHCEECKVPWPTLGKRFINTVDDEKGINGNTGRNRACHINGCKSAALEEYLDNIVFLEDFYRVVPEWQETIGSKENKFGIPSYGCNYILVDDKRQYISLKDLEKRNKALPKEQCVSHSHLESFRDAKDMSRIRGFLKSKLTPLSANRNRHATGALLEELCRLGWTKEKGFLADQP